MKIAYVLVEDFHPGLQNKIYGQVNEWEKRGHEVVFVAPKTGSTFLSDGTILFEDSVLVDRDHGQLVRRNRFTRLNLLRRQYLFLKEALESVAPEICYGRYPFPYWGVTEAYSAGKPYVFEINSDDVTEYYIKHRTTGIYNQLFRRSVLEKAGGMVFVTNELAMSKSFAWYTGFRLVLGNSVNVSAFPYVEDTGTERPNICFIGSPKQKWHGLEKLGLIAKALPESVLHIVGPKQEQYQSVGGEVFDNMVFHGYLNDLEAKQVVAKMDVGISTLSLYEKDMFEACPLKARQYFSQGVPVIGAYKETDVDEEPFYLQLPNVLNNVAENLSLIRDYVQKVHGDATLRHKTREFARTFLDVEQKEGARLDFLKRVTENG